MKSALLSLLILVSAVWGFDPNLVAENKSRPTAFAGVPWGARPEEAIRILTDRCGAVGPVELPADQTKIDLTGGNFANQSAEKWTLEFSNSKLFAATVRLKSEGAASAKYREIKLQLVGKYGTPIRDGKPPLTPTTDKRRAAAPAAVLGQKYFGNVAAWRFTPTLADKEPKTIEIILATETGLLATDEAQLTVMLRYINEAFAPLPGSKPATPRKPSGPDDL